MPVATMQDSYAPVGDDRLVNSTLPGYQTQPSVTFLADGRYLIVFQSFDSTYDVRGRIFHADGPPAGADFPINTTADADQDLPRVAALAGGGFVTVWEDFSNGANYDIKARIYATDGTAADEITITSLASGETSPSVAGLPGPGGGFVVTWTDSGDGDGDVRAQICQADGSAAGSALAVNETTSGAQDSAMVTVLANGNIVVVWHSDNGHDVLMRLFGPAGAALTGELSVASDPTGIQGGPCVVALAGGGFAVAWTDGNSDADGYGIRARLFEADGDPAGADFPVNTLTTGDQQLAAIAALPDGGFMAAWMDGAGPGTDDIRAQRFDQSGNAVDGEFIVNTHVEGLQYNPALAVDAASGALVVAWADLSDSGVGGDSDGAIVSRLFTPGGVEPPPPPPPPPPSPTADLDGAAPGIDYAGAFTEGDAGAAIGAGITVTAPNVPITGATITITDAAAGDQLVLAGALPATIIVLSGPGTAQLVLAGAGTAADWAAALAQVRYTTASDNPDAFGADIARTIGVVVSDGVNGSMPATATLAISAVNDDPAAGNIGDPVSFTEGDAFVRLDLGGNATLSDVDSADFGGGSLSLGVLTGGTSQDLILVGATADVALSGNDILVGGITIGTITSQSGGQPLTISLNADATPARVEALLRAIAYTNLVGDDPSEGTRPVAAILTDGDGGATAFGVNVAVIAVNDAPANLVPGAQSVDEDGALMLGGGDALQVSDADAGTSPLRVTVSVSQGGLTLSGTSGLAFSSGDGTNDATMTFIGTAAAINAALDGLTYRPAANYYGPDTLSLSTSDQGATGSGGALTDTDTVAITVSPTNDEPILLGTGTNPVYAEDAAAVDLFCSVAASTVETSQTFTSLTLTVTNVTDGAAEILRIDGSDVALTDGASATTAASGLMVNVSLAGTTATLSFAGAALGAAQLQALVEGLGYRDASQNPTGGDRVVTITQLVDSGAGGPPGDNSAAPGLVSTVNVDPVNDAPAIDTGDATIVAEDSGPVAVTGISVSDPDADPASDDMQIDLSVGHGTLTLRTDVAGGIEAGDILSGNGTGSIRVRATQDRINATLGAPNGLLHSAQADFNGSDAVSLVLDDRGHGGMDPGLTGTSGSESDTETKTLTITAVNDAPLVAGDGGETIAAIAEDTADAGGTAVSTLFGSGQFSDGTDDYAAYGGSAPDGMAGVAVVAGGDGSAGQWQYQSGALWIDIGAASPGAAMLLGSSIMIRFNPAPDFNGEAPALVAHLVDASAGAIASGTIVDLSGANATGGITRYSSGTVTVGQAVTAVDDAAVAHDDGFTIDEAALLTGNVFDDHGAGADVDVDGPPAVSAVNGSTLDLGQPILLASGALLTLNADGSFTYDTNHAFDATPASGSGASNLSVPDSFSYTLAGGSVATVTLTVTGLDTNDLLLGTAGDDVMSGGTGNDVYFVDEALDAALEAANQGTDLVYASISYALAGGSSVEILSTTRNSGTGAIGLTGNELDNIIYGNAGINLLIGGAGNDLLVGLDGNDLLIGDDGNDTLDGGAGNNILLGGAGVDTLLGGDNEDVLDGGTGADGLYGGDGDDSYYVDQASDFVVEAANRGTDIVYASASYALAAGSHVEILSTTSNAGTDAIDLAGNDFANTIYGNNGVNTLRGGGGSGDNLIGLGGNDTYIVQGNEQVFEASGGGTDIIYTNVSHALASGQEVEFLSTTSNAGTDAIDLTGNDFANTIYGNNGANALHGGGGSGDVLIGLGGNDTYIVQGNEQVVEAAGGGTDIVYTSVSHALASGQEVEILSTTSNAGTSAIDLTGNAFANTIYGNNGANVLNGGSGNDTLLGFGGADTFAFTTTLGAGNVDRIADFVSGTDKIALDDAVFTGLGLGSLPANAFVTGTAAGDADDRIIYNSANGNLYYDADGTGAIAAILFANLQGNPTLTASDFQVI